EWGRGVAGPAPEGGGLLSLKKSRNGGGGSAPSVPPVTPSPPTLSPNGERECIEFAARSYAIARLAHQRSPSARASSASRKRQPLLRQKLKSHLRRMSSSPANSTRVWIRFARSTLTRSLCSPTSLKQWENCNGNSSAEAPALVALTCTAPRSNTICERCTGTSCSVVVAESANASDSNRAGFSRIRCNNSDGLVCVDSFSGEKPA